MCWPSTARARVFLWHHAPMKGAGSWIVVGCGLGLLGVALGAFGAHGLEEVLAEGERGEWWQTAVDYHLWHAPMVVMAGLLAARTGRGQGAAMAFTLGILVFSGTLYAMGLGGPTWLGAITPLGGTALMVGWVLAARAGMALTD